MLLADLVTVFEHVQRPAAGAVAVAAAVRGRPPACSIPPRQRKEVWALPHVAQPGARGQGGKVASGKRAVASFIAPLVVINAVKALQTGA